MSISILGTGAMGTGMGTAVINAGIPLIVYNRAREKTESLVQKGATCVDSPVQAVTGSDISIFIVSSGKITYTILNQPDILAILQGKTIINAATADTQLNVKIKQLVESHGGKFACVGMQAIPQTLENKTGALLVGCDPTDWGFLFAELSKFSGEVLLAGEVKDLFGVDLFSRLGFTLSLAKISYMVATAQRYGVSPEIYEPIIVASDPNAKYFLPNMTAHSYPLASGSIKDNIHLLIEDSNALKNKNISIDLLEVLLTIFKKASANGLSAMDASCMVEVLENFHFTPQNDDID